MSHAQAEHLQFVDQRDVDAAKNIFKQLGHFRGARGADRHDTRNNLRVNRLRGAAARRIHAADDLGNLRQPELLVAGIFALRRKRQKEIAGDIFVFRTGRDRAVQAALLQDRQNQLFGRAWIGCGFENNQLTLLQMRLDRNGGLLDVSTDPVRGAHRVASERR